MAISAVSIIPPKKIRGIIVDKVNEEFKSTETVVSTVYVAH